PETTILWLYGPAGAGKSAIMQTLAHQLQDAGRRAASVVLFFFSNVAMPHAAMDRIYSRQSHNSSPSTLNAFGLRFPKSWSRINPFLHDPSGPKCGS
ncbi:hypothetical protein C8R45DRAFT_836482, partial [Mycena sanguinolenta]